MTLNLEDQTFLYQIQVLWNDFWIKITWYHLIEDSDVDIFLDSYTDPNPVVVSYFKQIVHVLVVFVEAFVSVLAISANKKIQIQVEQFVNYFLMSPRENRKSVFVCHEQRGRYFYGSNRLAQPSFDDKIRRNVSRQLQQNAQFAALLAQCSNVFFLNSFKVK